MRNNLVISEQTLSSYAASLLQIVRFNESGLIINPVGDYPYTNRYILQDRHMLKKYLGKFYQSYIFVVVDMAHQHSLEALGKALDDACLKRSIRLKVPSESDFGVMVDSLINDGYELVFFIEGIDKAFLENRQFCLSLEKITREHRVSMIYFSEKNLTHLQFTNEHNDYSSMFQNVLFQKYYDFSDTVVFMRHFAKQWHVRLDKKTEKEIYNTCGGNLWLIKQILRSMRQYADKTIAMHVSQQIFQVKLYATWNQFYEDEKKIIKQIALNSTVEDDAPALQYLLEAGVIKKIGKQYRLLISTLRIPAISENETDKIHFQQGKIMKGSMSIDDLFAPKEKRILMLFLQRKYTVLSRKQIAVFVWGEQDAHSDWAIDQTISRLRSKLMKLGFSKDVIKARKGEGYVFS